jgi:hypothetical protein
MYLSFMKKKNNQHWSNVVLWIFKHFVKGQNQFFDFLNHQSKVYKHLTFTPQVPTPKNKNLQTIIQVKVTRTWTHRFNLAN